MLLLGVTGALAVGLDLQCRQEDMPAMANMGTDVANVEGLRLVGVEEV